MHVFFSAIGGVGIGPLAIIAKEAGYEVSGSDKQDSQYINYLREKGITDIHIGQTYEQIEAVNSKSPIDWYVYSSAVAIENPEAPEFKFCDEHGIERTKRDQLINKIIADKQLKLIAVAGTHGKTTTTGMLVWLFKQLRIPVSYSVGAKLSFGDMGAFVEGSEFFVYEADEFDRNFLEFEPYLSLISGVSWDHHEIYPTRDEYQQAFRDFITQSKRVVVWEEDRDYLGLSDETELDVQISNNKAINSISLKGLYNRLDAWLAIEALNSLTGTDIGTLVAKINEFPGLQRRMEEILPNLYTDDAHTPDKIRGAMSVADEIAKDNGQKVVVVYEPLTNRRQHFMIDDYKDCFSVAAKVYWLPSYLAREDPNQKILSPDELISHLANPSIAESASISQDLKENIQKHLDNNDMVVCITGGGGHSLDEWIRTEFLN